MTRRTSIQVAIEDIVEAAGRLEEYRNAVATNGEFHLSVENAPYMRLVIEHVWNGEVSVCHTYVQNGDAMRDPEIVFDAKNNWAAVEYTQDNLGVYQRAPKGRRLNLGGFANMWARNLRSQGFAEAAAKAANNDKVLAGLAIRDELEAELADILDEAGEWATW